MDFGRSSRHAHPTSARPSVSVSELPRSRSSQFILREIPLKDPFALYAALRERVATCFILESAPGPERLAEYTYIGFAPAHRYTLRGGELQVDGRSEGSLADPLDRWRAVLNEHRPPLDVRWSKYLGGLVGYIGYDFVRYVEPSLGGPDAPTERSFPEVELGLYLDGVVVDHRRGRAFYFSHGEDRSPFVETIVDEARTPPDSNSDSERRLHVGELTSDTPREAFLKNVERALGAIHDGEVYQLVLSRKLSGSYAGDLFAFYRSLREINPSPYMYCLEFDRGTPQKRTIIGSSPEMLLAVREGTVVTYPIAGTRPLGHDADERARYRSELLSDEKERAEHDMLVDLARNDVGRVSAYGSVRVPQYMGVERFSHVQHLVSRVEGRLREGLDAFDAFAALFPAGTVTGAPKVRAMEWIAALEPSARGPYAGIVGYFSLTGGMDSAIAIRTLFSAGNALHVQAGAGIVADSEPRREWEETEHKLGALVTALEGGP